MENSKGSSVLRIYSDNYKTTKTMDTVVQKTECAVLTDACSSLLIYLILNQLKEIACDLNGFFSLAQSSFLFLLDATGTS